MRRIRAAESPSQHWHHESAWTVSKMADIAVAYIGLVAADIVLRCAGFHLFHRAVRRCPTRSLKALESAAVRTVCSAVDAAALYHFKEVLRLQKSAVISVCRRM